jgi:membrane-bound lytic murein transglycosylase D
VGLSLLCHVPESQAQVPDVSPGATAVSLPGKRGAFETPKGLEGRVAFWIYVFTKYGKNHRVFHHRQHPEIVYSVLDFSDLEANLKGRELEKRRLKEANAELKRIKTSLLHLSKGKGPRNDFERRIVSRFKILPGNPLQNYKKAADKKSLRYQRGIKERYRDGLVRSGRYLYAIEHIFEEEGLPKQLGRLPLVESSFDYEAYSSVGAAGIWQFMRSTGRRFMRIDASIDERRDPIIATRAAAKYLKGSYTHFEDWSLAVTSYNHGVAGVNRAVKQTGSKDLAKIIREYKGKSFGFASGNFYASFLAALEVEQNAELYFPGLQRESPWTFDEIVLGKSISFSKLVASTPASKDRIRDLNRSFRTPILRDRVKIPKGTLVKVPKGMGTQLLDKVAGSRIHELHHGLLPKPRYIAKYHRVRKGETIGLIARKYGVSVQALMRENRLKNANRIRIGQRLRVPGSGRVVTKKRGKKAVAAKKRHKVRRGDSLYAIARKYSVSWKKLAKANKIKKPYNLRIGAELVIP